MESVHISRFTMHKIASKLQNFVHTKLASKFEKNARTTKFIFTGNLLHFRRTCKVLFFYYFWFKFYDKFCCPYPIIKFLCIFNHQSENLSLKLIIIIAVKSISFGFKLYPLFVCFINHFMWSTPWRSPLKECV